MIKSNNRSPFVLYLEIICVISSMSFFSKFLHLFPSSKHLIAAKMLKEINTISYTHWHTVCTLV